MQKIELSADINFKRSLSKRVILKPAISLVHGPYTTMSRGLAVPAHHVKSNQELSLASRVKSPKVISAST